MDTHQAIYDAVRSRIGGCDTSHVIERAAQEAFDFSYARQLMQQEIAAVGYEMARPSVVFRPTIQADGDHWCVLLGENLQVGVSGFGKSPAEAFAEFDKAFWNGMTPAAARKALEDSTSGLADANPNPNTPSTVKELPHG